MIVKEHKLSGVFHRVITSTTEFNFKCRAPHVAIHIMDIASYCPAFVRRFGTEKMDHPCIGGQGGGLVHAQSLVLAG